MSSFARRLGLGWVVVGQVCFGKVHHSDVVSCNRPNVLINACVNNFHIKEKMHSSIGDLGEKLFLKTEQDNMVGVSVEDREFLTIKQMQKGPSVNWVTPLPFRSPRPKLPNNRSYPLTYTHAFLLYKSRRNESIL